jgi:hypothetical protein
MVARNNEMVSVRKGGNITSLMIDRAGRDCTGEGYLLHVGSKSENFGLGVLFANPSFADCGVCAGVFGGSSLPGTG